MGRGWQSWAKKPIPPALRPSPQFRGGIVIALPLGGYED